MATPFPSLTKTWHSSPYPAISPSRPELSVKGKTVLVTGGGRGIGAAIARAFAEAGAAGIAIMGRSEGRLLAAKSRITEAFPSTKVITAVADVTKEHSVVTASEKILDQLGKIDICICNAGSIGSPAPAATTNLKAFIEPFEVNVIGSLLVAQAFLKQAEAGTFLLHMSTSSCHFPPIPSQMSAYIASKAASTKLFDYIAFENPVIHVVNVQPAVTASDVMKKNGAPDLDDRESLRLQAQSPPLANDTTPADLAGHFCVWLVSPEARFLKSKYVWSNWDVNELKARKEEILETELLDIKLGGLSFRGWTAARMYESPRP